MPFDEISIELVAIGELFAAFAIAVGMLLKTSIAYPPPRKTRARLRK